MRTSWLRKRRAPHKSLLPRPLRSLFSRHPVEQRGERPPAGTPAERGAAFLRRHWIIAGVVVALAVVFAVLDVAIDEPMRKWLQGAANERLKGYSVRIPRADFKPWILSATLFDASIIQQAHPETPVALLGEASVDVDWSALLRGRLVADMVIVRPVFHIDTVQLAEEWNDKVPLKNRGWQQLWELYPLKVNTLAVIDGSVDYVDTASKRTLKMERFGLRASNIRHVIARGLVYPSPVSAEAVLFDKGRFAMEGHANFLMVPHAGFNVVAEIARLPLESLGPIVADYHVRLRQGTLSTRGQFEVAPDRYIANLDTLDIDGLHVDYVSGAETPEIARAKRNVKEAARYAEQAPELRMRARSLTVNGNFGYVSATEPRYRIFLDQARMRLRNFSNRPEQGQSDFSLDGLFMGSGLARLRGVMRPTKGPANFALDAEVVNTDLRNMNDVLRAHGKFDVSAGQMSVYTQVAVRNGRIRGYVKPLFQNVEVYDREDDRDKSFFQKLYEKIVEGVSKILENPQRDEVATVVDVSGPVADPKASTLQIIGGLLRNAFIKAILPGFDVQRGNPGVEPTKPEKPSAEVAPAPAKRLPAAARYAACPAPARPDA